MPLKGPGPSGKMWNEHLTKQAFIVVWTFMFVVLFGVIKVYTAYIAYIRQFWNSFSRLRFSYVVLRVEFSSII